MHTAMREMSAQAATVVLGIIVAAVTGGGDADDQRVDDRPTVVGQRSAVDIDRNADNVLAHDELIDAVRRNYQSMQLYSDHGTVVRLVDREGERRRHEMAFESRFNRPSEDTEEREPARHEFSMAEERVQYQTNIGGDEQTKTFDSLADAAERYGNHPFLQSRLHEDMPLTEFQELGMVRRLGSEAVRDELCNVLGSFGTRGHDQDNEKHLQVWIDPEEEFIRRCEVYKNNAEPLYEDTTTNDWMIDTAELPGSE